MAHLKRGGRSDSGQRQCQLVHLNKLTLLDPRGKSVALKSLWVRRRIVLVFLRHLGCRTCWKELTELEKVKLKLITKARQHKASGDNGQQYALSEVVVVAISLGTPKQVGR